jgi:dihydrofolate synthase / folylpolyglutamate synthase
MHTDIAYQEALDYIYSFVDYSLTRAFRYSPDKFNLERMFLFLEKLGSPHQYYPVIHVAGTKGKGSVSALCASALHAAGYKTGFYSSPHLQEFTERIQVDGQQIPPQELAALVDEIKPVVAGIPQLTTFEITTALGFLYFARQKVDIAVIEVGLGGRLDATNVVTPLVSVITALSYDHMAVLGNTLAEIAGEKAGIIKHGCPVVMSPQVEEARQVVLQVAEQRGSPLIETGQDVLFSPVSHSLEGQVFSVWIKEDQPQSDALVKAGGPQAWKPLILQIPLLGGHQVENAVTAYVTLLSARQSGLQITDEEIHLGFSQVSWPGRFEILRRSPPVVVDSAHNPASAQRLRQTLDDYFPGQDVVLVFGASEDKDIQGMYAELLPRVREIITTQSVHPRAWDAGDLARLAEEFGKPARAVMPVESAFYQALETAGKDAVVLVTGSLFVVAAVRETWPRMESVVR